MKKKQHQLILIDSQAKIKVSEVAWDGKLESLQKIVGGLIEPHRLYSDDLLLVDEEWNCKSGSNRFPGGFAISGDTAPLDGNGQAGKWFFGGRGVIVGVDKRDNFTAPKLTLLNASQLVSFPRGRVRGDMTT